MTRRFFMKKGMFLVLTLVLLCTNSAYGKPLSKVTLEVKTISDDSIYINVVNPTCDTLYLFDSYFPYADDPHLHRLNDDLAQPQLSLVPLPCYVGWQPHRITDNLLLCRGGLPYHFLVLTPMSTQTIALSSACLHQSEYYRDFDTDSCFYFGIDFSLPQQVETNSLTIVMAVFRDVQNLTSEWIQQNAIHEDPAVCKKAYDYIVDYEIGVVSVPLLSYNNIYAQLQLTKVIVVVDSLNRRNT